MTYTEILAKQINEERKELDLRLAASGFRFSEPSVLRQSKKLDRLINLYQLIKSIENPS
jgi:hypothetical protein